MNTTDAAGDVVSLVICYIFGTARRFVTPAPLQQLSATDRPTGRALLYGVEEHLELLRIRTCAIYVRGSLCPAQRAEPIIRGSPANLRRLTCSISERHGTVNEARRSKNLVKSDDAKVPNPANPSIPAAKRPHGRGTFLLCGTEPIAPPATLPCPLSQNDVGERKRRRTSIARQGGGLG
jgi:hypothetical protein